MVIFLIKIALSDWQELSDTLKKTNLQTGKKKKRGERINLHSDTHEIPGKFQNISNRACCIKISSECCCSWETSSFTLWLFLRRRWKELPCLKEKNKFTTTSKNSETFHCFACLGIEGNAHKNTPQQLHDTALKPELLAHGRLFLLMNKNT